MIILFVFNLLLLLLLLLYISISIWQKDKIEILKEIKKWKNSKTRKGLKKKDYSVSIILSLHLFAVYLHIHTWNDTKRLLSCTFFFFFSFSFNAKQLLPCLLYFFFKILANGIVYFRACRRGIYTDLYLCVCMCVYAHVYVCMLSMQEIHLRFFRYGAVRSRKKRRKESIWYRRFSLPLRDRPDFYDRSRVVLSREKYRKHRIVAEI